MNDSTSVFTTNSYLTESRYDQQGQKKTIKNF